MLMVKGCVDRGWRAALIWGGGRRRLIGVRWGRAVWWRGSYGCGVGVRWGGRANIMCPGLTHKNVVEELAAKPVPDNTPVAILAEVELAPA